MDNNIFQPLQMHLEAVNILKQIMGRFKGVHDLGWEKLQF
jgi:hypothetical protein